MSKTAGITNDLAQKSGDPPGGVPGGSPDDFRRDNIAGPHGTFHFYNRFFSGLSIFYLMFYRIRADNKRISERQQIDTNMYSNVNEM